MERAHAAPPIEIPQSCGSPIEVIPTMRRPMGSRPTACQSCRRPHTLTPLCIPSSYLLWRFPFLISRCSAHPKNILPPALDIQDGVDSPSLLCYTCIYDLRCYLSSIHQPNCSYSWPKASSSDKTVRPLFTPRIHLIPPDMKHIMTSISADNTPSRSSNYTRNMDP